MARKLTHRFAGPARRLGLIVAVLAVVGQVAFAGMMLVETTRAALGGQSFICHVAEGGTAPAAHHHGNDCDTCPLCQAFAEASALAAPSSAPELPAPALAWQRRGAMPPPARAPPVLAAAAPWPRGPPV